MRGVNLFCCSFGFWGLGLVAALGKYCQSAGCRSVCLRLCAQAVQTARAFSPLLSLSLALSDYVRTYVCIMYVCAYVCMCVYIYNLYNYLYSLHAKTCCLMRHHSTTCRVEKHIACLCMLSDCSYTSTGFKLLKDPRPQPRKWPPQENPKSQPKS